MPENENRLIYEIMRELGKFGGIFRTNAGHVRTITGGSYHGLPKGFSDLLFVRPDGVSCFIECKVGANQATPEQEKFLERMRGLNCRAGVARSVEEAAELAGIYEFACY